MAIPKSALASALGVIASLAILVGLDLRAAPEARAAGPCGQEATALDSEETAFLRLINDYRARNGVPAVQPSAPLRRSAAWMAADMATKNYFSHTDGLGRQALERARDCGYPSPVGENIAAGTNSDTAAEAFAQFVGSAPHKANMLDARYRVIGISRAMNAASTYTWYWATDFGVDEDPALPAHPTVAQGAGGAATTAGRLADKSPLWVNDLAYGSAGGGFYWDPATKQVWTRERNWHAFSPAATRKMEPLWVDDLEYGSAGGGFYLDTATGQVWTAERGWHTFGRR